MEATVFDMEYPAPRRKGSGHGYTSVVRVSAGTDTRDDRFGTWRTHGTDDWLLIHTISGEGMVGGTHGEVRVAHGDAVLLAPGVLHDYVAAPGSRWQIAHSHFHPRADWAPLLTWPQVTPGVGAIATGDEVHRRVTDALLRAARLSPSALDRSLDFAENALEEALLWYDTQNPLAGRIDERILTVLETVALRLTGPLDIETLARAAHLSVSRLSRLFRAQVGVTPQRYIENQRIAHAQRFLETTDWPIGEVALKSGWTDPLYFSRRFRAATGSTPTAYRRARAGRPEG